MDLFRLNAAAAVLHVCLFTLTVSLANFDTSVEVFFSENLFIPLNSTKTFTFKPEYSTAASVHVAPLVAWHFAVTTVFHIFYLFSTKYHGLNGLNQCRWLEYALSAPPMVAAISISCGERDAFVLLALCFLTGLTMMCGHVSELVNFSELGEGSLGPLLIGVLLQVAVWLTILSRFAATVSTVRSDYSIPPYVFGIVASQGLLFTSFAVVHTCHISGVCDGESAEISYITLSFVSKAVLGMLLLFYALRLPSMQEVEPRFIAAGLDPVGEPFDSR